jgi:hypothetical protein
LNLCSPTRSSTILSIFCFAVAVAFDVASYDVCTRSVGLALFAHVIIVRQNRCN